MKKLLLAALLGFAPAPALAQATPAAPAPQAASDALPDADPAMWVIRDEDTTIYLFGTFHMLDGRSDWFNDEVRTAFDESDELVLEAILPDNPATLQPLVQRLAVDPSGRTLSQRLSAEQNAALGRALSSVGAPAQALDPYEPWFASMNLAAVATVRLGLSPEHGPEGILTRAARARNIPVAELEGIERQLNMFDTMPEAQQLAQLATTIANIDKIGETLTPMLAAWSSGNVEELVTMMNASSAQDPALHRMMFTDRNAAWASWIRERMARPGTVFLAVGAGHLAGGDSVQSLLEAQGVRAERVPSQNPAEQPAS